MKFLKARFAVAPEIISLYRDRDTNHIRNFGFIMSRTPAIINRLLNATKQARTIQKSSGPTRIKLKLVQRKPKQK